eukprot:scaffold301_cov243-Pinguiococcus_pyrenoidosus.AAC.4
MVSFSPRSAKVAEAHPYLLLLLLPGTAAAAALSPPREHVGQLDVQPPEPGVVRHAGVHDADAKPLAGLGPQHLGDVLRPRVRDGQKHLVAPVVVARHLVHFKKDAILEQNGMPAEAPGRRKPTARHAGHWETPGGLRRPKVRKTSEMHQRRAGRNSPTDSASRASPARRACGCTCCAKRAAFGLCRQRRPPTSY